MITAMIYNRWIVNFTIACCEFEYLNYRTLFRFLKLLEIHSYYKFKNRGLTGCLVTSKFLIIFQNFVKLRFLLFCV